MRKPTLSLWISSVFVSLVWPIHMSNALHKRIKHKSSDIFAHGSITINKVGDTIPVRFQQQNMKARQLMYVCVCVCVRVSTSERSSDLKTFYFCLEREYDLVPTGSSLSCTLEKVLYLAGQMKTCCLVWREYMSRHLWPWRYVSRWQPCKLPTWRVLEGMKTP